MVGSTAWDVQIHLPNGDTGVKPAGSLKGLDEVSSGCTENTWQALFLSLASSMLADFLPAPVIS